MHPARGAAGQRIVSGSSRLARRAGAGALLVLVVSLAVAGCGGRQSSHTSPGGGEASVSPAPIEVEPTASGPGGASSPSIVVQQDDLDELSAALDDEKALETEVNDEMAADSP